MQRAHARRIALGVVLTTAGLAAASVAGRAAPRPAAAAAVGAASDTWDTFTADLTIRHAEVAADGTLLRAAPPGVTFRIERTLTWAGWHSSMTLLHADESPSGAGPANDYPFAISRMEYDDGSRQPRLYDQRGRLVPGPSTADIARLGLPASQSTWTDPPILGRQPGRSPAPPSRDWLNALVAAPDRRDVRQAALERRFGLAAFRKGFEQFSGSVGDARVEMDVATDTALPFAVRSYRQGLLSTDSRIAYMPYAGGVFVRRSMHTERFANDGSGAKTVTDFEIANITIETKGGAR